MGFEWPCKTGSVSRAVCGACAHEGSVRFSHTTLAGEDDTGQSPGTGLFRGLQRGHHLYLGKCAGWSCRLLSLGRAGVDSGQGEQQALLCLGLPASSCILVLRSCLSHLDSVLESVWLHTLLQPVEGPSFTSCPADSGSPCQTFRPGPVRC